MTLAPAAVKRNVAVVGSGPAGLACATTAAQRGHGVTLFDAAEEIGGQFNLARRIPGKEEFAETLRYFRTMLAKHGVRVELNRRVEADALRGFDDVILATGIVPRSPDIPGIDHPSVASYVDIVSGRRVAGKRVAIIGAGGIGFDVAEYLSHTGVDSPAAFRAEWGIDEAYAQRGGIAPPQEVPSPRELWLLQRKSSKVGDGLAKTTGWIRRTLLRKRGVAMHAGVEYVKIDDAGLHVVLDGKPQTLAVDTIVICAGQEPRRELVPELARLGITPRLIGGADVAAELDAKRAIDQGTRVALAL